MQCTCCHQFLFLSLMPLGKDRRETDVSQLRGLTGFTAAAAAAAAAVGIQDREA